MSLAEVGTLEHWGAKESHIIVLYAEVLKEVSFARGFDWCKVQDFDDLDSVLYPAHMDCSVKGSHCFFLSFVLTLFTSI